jgi:uncharacterized membrane protein
MEIDFVKNGLLIFAHSIQIFLEIISILCIVCGLIATGRLVITQPYLLRELPFSELRLCFGAWLSLALEFQLGSDIVATTISPSFDSLGLLAAIAIIRTFLNYFLAKELEHERNINQRKRTI